MGTEIELKIADVSLDYAKNHMGNDYGCFFQAGDIARRKAGGINYDYIRENNLEDELPDIEEALVRPLARVLPRLNLLGHTIEGARAEYDAAIRYDNEISSGSAATFERPEHLSFDEFCSLVNLFPVSTLNGEYIDFDTDERAKVAQGRFAEHADLFERLPWTDGSDMYWSESSFLARRVGILSAGSMLQVFGLSPENAGAEVIWQFGPLVDAGWASRESFVGGANRLQTHLVATEGASDARILRRALDFLRPDIADFFRFIDVEERHHFWGTGNLVRFAEGLLRIDVQNQVIFLLDNDAEGVDAYRKLQVLNLPDNMRSMVLPAIEEFCSFPARGPEGTSLSDINGRAAAIECYLDLNLRTYPPAEVIWSNYKRDIDAWHGVLEHKESYMKHFMKQDLSSLTDGRYNTSKLVKILDALIAKASATIT